ncbi:hypothetical protein BDD41_3749 [Paracoccus versutus]|uniref:Uncharacterized protein n=1 Tax=Paracoccus versutus TaxID=34007 RepID=A0A3D9XDR4_PARVE|nr:hypothetical protein BDD41_3749 [Paracoccus versutus]
MKRPAKLAALGLLPLMTAGNAAAQALKVSDPWPASNSMRPGSCRYRGRSDRRPGRVPYRAARQGPAFGAAVGHGRHRPGSRALQPGQDAAERRPRPAADHQGHLRQARPAAVAGAGRRPAGHACAVRDRAAGREGAPERAHRVDRDRRGQMAGRQGPPPAARGSSPISPPAKPTDGTKQDSPDASPCVRHSGRGLIWNHTIISLSAPVPPVASWRAACPRIPGKASC